MSGALSRTFQFFMTLDELKDTMEPIAEKCGASLWSFPEAAMTGQVSPVPALEDGKRRMKWFGALPRDCTVWNSFEAATEAGFICVVRPEIDESKRTLYMGEIFTPASDLKASNSLFPPVRRALVKRLPTGTTIFSDRDPGSPPGGKGPKCSSGALALHEAGYVLRQGGVAFVRYVPSPDET